MKPDLSNQSILITGAGRGLGKHLAKHLASCGATVGISDIDADNANETATEISESYGKAQAYFGDLSKKDVFEKLQRILSVRRAA